MCQRAVELADLVAAGGVGVEGVKLEVRNVLCLTDGVEQRVGDRMAHALVEQEKQEQAQPKDKVGEVVKIAAESRRPVYDIGAYHGTQTV